MSRDSSVGRLRAGRPRFDSRQGQDFFYSPPPILEPPIQWVPGALSLVVKQGGRKADHSPQSSAEFKNDGAIPPLPQTSSWYKKVNLSL
jgi:hypothetical protein